MQTKRFRRFVLALVACLGAALGAQAAEERNYILATGSSGGTYYPVGVALATLIKEKLQPMQNIGISAINSAGSGENLKLLQENEAQFAILMGMFGSYAWTGIGTYAKEGPQTHLRSVSMLWQNVEQFIVKREHARSGSIEDMAGLKGEKMAMGNKNSGTISSNRTILESLGIDIDKDYDLLYGGYGPSAEALRNGQVEGVSLPAGIPTDAVTKLFTGTDDKVKILEFTDAQIKKANAGMNLWTRFVIPAETYPGQAKDINTMAQPNFLAVRNDVDEEAVYLITKTIYENLPFLHSSHQASKAIKVEAALVGLPAPLHPGAAKYYREVGLEIPEGLIGK